MVLLLSLAAGNVHAQAPTPTVSARGWTPGTATAEAAAAENAAAVTHATSATKAVAPKAIAVGSVDDGQRAFDTGDYAGARAIWTAQAELGDDGAAVALAGMLDQGIGTARDPVAALRWYTVAAGHGMATAEFDVGVMLDSGRGASRDVGAAATWYARAAAHGNRRAQFNLGQLYAAGEGVPLNPAAARAWYDLAAHNGIAAATVKLASLPAPTSQQVTSSPNLRPVEAQLPLANQALTMRPGNEGVEFVWVAPPQPVPVTYYVEVAAVGSRGTRRAAAGYIAETAVVLDLGKTPGDYAWRVYVVDQRRQRYVANDWQRFSITAAESSHE